MVWTLLTLLVVGWLLVLVVGIGGPWSWVLPLAAGLLLLWRAARTVLRR